MQNNYTLSLAKSLRQELAENFPPKFAKLYSQYTKLITGQSGLSAWRKDEASIRLNDAIQLIESALIERDAGVKDWYVGMRRAAELLEWLSHPDLNPNKLPLLLLSAACYQLAGYPAIASSLLEKENNKDYESKILYSLFKADFPKLLNDIVEYWSVFIYEDIENIDSTKLLQNWIVSETISSLGIISAAMRWGDNDRLNNALNKLSAISKIFIYGDDSYSWLLCKLCSEVVKNYIKSSMRNNIEKFYSDFDELGKFAIEKYLRINYEYLRSIAWPSQIQGIQQLKKNNSFAICTPTGSGKTSIAELAILQDLFNKNNTNEHEEPLVMYLVPSKALASEMESKLSSVLQNLSKKKIVVTGLYGGTDWGPTDAWLTSEESTVLICTYEKAEALIKFLGPLFIHRIKLIIIDEAHIIQYEDKNLSSYIDSENRSLRLENLGTRLMTHIEHNNRCIALSAVANEAQYALASWITGADDSTPEKTSYRSTRQLIGCLKCRSNRTFEIRYDLLDGNGLEFSDEETSDRPYIPNPFPAFPNAKEWENGGPEKYLRPYLFWAAMHLAAANEKGQQNTVLISITQQINYYSKDFLKLIDNTWSNIKLPNFFSKPTDTGKKAIWERCLLSCEDYFGRDSYEYRLLEKGIVLHHGKMPGLMARLLIELIQKKVVNIVLATSTLSEGINLPIDVILIPSLRRYNKSLEVREFSNLVGRAGRPGYSIEGRSLVLIDDNKKLYKNKQAKKYYDLIGAIKNQNINSTEVDKNARSPLAELIKLLFNQWHKLTKSRSKKEFFEWLEQTVPLEYDFKDEQNEVIETLDTLDNILLSSIVEIEQIQNKDLGKNELENELKRVWQKTYARYASEKQKTLEDIFIHRGVSIKTNIYPTYEQRKKFYHTSLPPRHGAQLIDNYPHVKEYLKQGFEYAGWTSQERFNFIKRFIEYISEIKKFKIKDLNNKTKWYEILQWWLDPDNSKRSPSIDEISKWYDYISTNFIYRINWGLGSIIALSFDEINKRKLQKITLEDWPYTGLPWVVFWLKELLTWGTLDPVAAYLLSYKIEYTRFGAELSAFNYYEEYNNQLPNEILNAKNIREWSIRNFSEEKTKKRKSTPPKKIQVKLLRNFSGQPKKLWKVIPVKSNDQLLWIDPAGYVLANCKMPYKWRQEYLNLYDFTLDVIQNIVITEKYVELGN